MLLLFATAELFVKIIGEIYAQKKQEAQLPQRDRATLRVIEYFAK